MIISLSSRMVREPPSFRSSRKWASRSVAFLPRSFIYSLSWLSITVRNLERKRGMQWITFTLGELCSWLIHSSSTIGASYSLQVSNFWQTAPINPSRSKFVLQRLANLILLGVKTAEYGVFNSIVHLFCKISNFLVWPGNQCYYLLKDPIEVFILEYEFSICL